MIKHTSKMLPDFEYFIKGENPTLLIHAGTHGDESESIGFVRKAVEKYEDNLPDFVFVPVVSPSSVRNKTRLNENGFDLNRIFFSDSKELEVIENIKVLNDYKFDLFVSFHEDPGSNEYYIYDAVVAHDSGFKTEESERVKKHNLKLKNMGIKLLTGVDDTEDVDLGYEFKEGYRKFIETHADLTNGMITVWSMLEKNVQTCLTPEIPGQLSLKQKELIIDTFFKDVLCIKLE